MSKWGLNVMFAVVLNLLRTALDLEICIHLIWFDIFGKDSRNSTKSIIMTAVSYTIPKWNIYFFMKLI